MSNDETISAHQRPRDVVLAILAKDMALHLPLYLECLESQSWPKARTHLYVRSNDNNDDTIEILERWLERKGGEYASVHTDYSERDATLRKYAAHEWNPHRFQILGAIRQESVSYARERGCHYLVVDCDNFIQPGVIEALVRLIESGFPVVAPLLLMEGSRYANLHVETDENGYFREGPYYEPIRTRALTGVMKVDVVHCTYMVAWDVLGAVSYIDASERYEYIVFSDALRRAGVEQYIDNRLDYGRLSQCNTEEEFSRELCHWIDDFACWKREEPARYIRKLIDKYDGEGTVTYATPLGTFTLFRSEEFIAAPMRHGQAWEQRLVEMLLPALSRDEDVLDVGAHVGTHTVPYSKHARHVHAFEPQGPIHTLLLQNLETNRCLNVTSHLHAVGHADRMVHMSNIVSDGASVGGRIHYRGDATPVNHGGIQVDSEGAPVGMRTLDGRRWHSVRLLKVDAEGAEPLVFWGARDTIRQHRPLILFERNFKRLSPKVLDRLRAPADAQDFRVEEFARVLDYHDPIELTENFLLLPKRSRAPLEGLLRRWAGGSFHLDDLGRVWCQMPKRGDFPTGILDENTICVWFGDVSFLVTGKVGSDSIEWSNGTVWQCT